MEPNLGEKQRITIYHRRSLKRFTPEGSKFLQAERRRIVTSNVNPIRREHACSSNHHEKVPHGKMEFDLLHFLYLDRCAKKMFRMHHSLSFHLIRVPNTRSLRKNVFDTRNLQRINSDALRHSFVFQILNYR